MFKDKILLITGGTGSFGNAVLRRFLKTDIKQIRILSRDEKKQDDMRHEYRDPKIKFYIGDVRNIDSIREAANGVDFIFHAAALKQVPSCEFYPMEAVQTNIIGADNVLRAAIEARVKRLAVLSTDKAAYPINAMGMTKALMEKVMVARSRLAADNGLVFCGTRYGNVMGSRGSVIPLFIQQIEAGEPITVTNPDMTRFMMTLENAVDLVLYAFKHAKPGDLFVQKAPAATIGTLAEAICRLLKSDVAVRVIGIRHGEKPHETLLTREERARSNDLGEYFQVPSDDRGLNYNLYFNQGKQGVENLEDYNSSNTHRLNVDEMMELLLRLPIVREAVERCAARRPQPVHIGERSSSRPSLRA